MSAEQKREGGSSTGAHTPRPWAVLDFTSEVKGLLSVVAGSDRHVAEIFPYGARCKGTTVAEHQANARLIAAAPDMLAALKLIVAFEDDATNIHADLDYYMEALNVARSAIAAAVGDRPDAAQPPIQREEESQ